MKRYSNFLRSMATVSLVVLYSFVTFFVPFSAAAEGVDRLEVATDPVAINSSAVKPVEKIPEIQAQESHTEEVVVDESEKEEETMTEIEEEQTEIIDDVIENTSSNEEVLATTSQRNSSDYSRSNNFSSNTPICESGEVYASIEVPENLVVRLGDEDQVFSGDWFPVVSGGVTFSESFTDIDQPYDVAIVRSGLNLRVLVSYDVVDYETVGQDMVNSLEFIGGQQVNAFPASGGSGYGFFIQFEESDCPEEPVDTCDYDFNKDGIINSIDTNLLISAYDSTDLEDIAIYDLNNDSVINSGDMATLLPFIGEVGCTNVCDVTNSPEITTAQSTVTIQDDSDLTVDQVIDLFGISVIDLDGEGEVTFTHDLTQEMVNDTGTYTITITATDNEDCMTSVTVTLVVEGDTTTKTGSKRNRSEGGGEVLGATTCEPYIKTFIKMGEVNFAEDVRKLQIFLNDYMAENLVVDGVYGQETFEAVKRFQIAEADEILDPWGITEPTGFVRETTSRRINNIMCPELNIQIPILYCVTTKTFIYPDGTVVEPEVYYQSIGITYPVNNQAGAVLGDYSQNSPLVGGYGK